MECLVTQRRWGRDGIMDISKVAQSGVLSMLGPQYFLRYDAETGFVVLEQDTKSAGTDVGEV